MKRGDWGFMGRESCVEECEIFTIAGLHKERRNRGGKPQHAGELWLTLSKHAGLLQAYQNITPLPMR